MEGGHYVLITPMSPDKVAQCSGCRANYAGMTVVGRGWRLAALYCSSRDRRHKAVALPSSPHPHPTFYSIMNLAFLFVSGKFVNSLIVR